MHAKSNTRLTAAVLALAAGAACASAQPTTQPANRPPAQVRQPATTAAGLDFCGLSDINGADVANPSDETVGEISDLILARGTGRIEYALITSGAIAGLGGKTIALPYNALRWDPTEERFVTDLTREQVRHASEFIPENWAQLDHTTWTEDLENWWDDNIGLGDGEDDDLAGDPHGDDDADDADNRDAYDLAVAAALAEANASPTTINGTITRVVRNDDHGDQVVAVEVLRTGAGPTHIVLGPSWYVMGQATAPMRGDTVALRVVPMARGDQSKWVAISGTIDGQNVVFRDDRGQSRWALQHEPSEGENARAHDAPGRLMLASDLLGAEARASDEDGGEVQNVIIERNSGHIAFIGFDPNENILGIADDIILVPWDLVSVNADHKARIDATREMLLASEEVPDDLDLLTQAPRPGSIYSAYGVEQPTYRSRAAQHRGQGAANSPWDAEGDFTRAFRDGPSANITGRVVEVKTHALTPGSPEATVVVVSSGGQQKHIVIGPSWYVDRQGLRFVTDQEVTVRGNTAVLNGTEYVGARTVMIDGRTVELWNDRAPAWNAGR